jgi:RNA polymerase sigma-70 factor, ECF subfamily
MIPSATTRLALAHATSDELIAACIDQRDEAAWEEFVRRFHPVIAGTVVRTARRLENTDRQLLDDLVQETYLKICANECRILRQFTPQSPESIFGLLKATAFSVVHDYFRSGRASKRGGGREAVELDNYAESVNAGRNGLPDFEREVLLGEIDNYLANNEGSCTTERDQQIFWLYYRHGMTSRAIGAISQIGLTQKGVESVLQRLTAMVRRRLMQSRIRRGDAVEGS